MFLGVSGVAGTALVAKGEGVAFSRASSLCIRTIYLAFQPSTSASSSTMRFRTLFREAAADSLFRCFLASFRHSASCSLVMGTSGSYRFWYLVLDLTTLPVQVREFFVRRFLLVPLVPVAVVLRTLISSLVSSSSLSSSLSAIIRCLLFTFF